MVPWSRPLLFLLVGLAAAGPARAGDDDKSRLLVLDLAATGDVSPEVASSFTDFVAVYATKERSLLVLSRRDLQRLAELEAERQRVGCDGESACIAEIAGAVGARYVLFGRMGTLGESTFVQLTLIDVDEAEPLGRAMASDPSLDQLAAKLERAVGTLVDDLGARVKKRHKVRVRTELSKKERRAPSTSRDPSQPRQVLAKDDKRPKYDEAKLRYLRKQRRIKQLEEVSTSKYATGWSIIGIGAGLSAVGVGGAFALSQYKVESGFFVASACAGALCTAATTAWGGVLLYEANEARTELEALGAGPRRADVAY